MLSACMLYAGNVHTAMGLPLAVDIPIDGEQTVSATPLPSLPSGSEGIFAESVTLLGEENIYIILPAILADNKDGTLTSIKTMGTNGHCVEIMPPGRQRACNTPGGWGERRGTSLVR